MDPELVTAKLELMDAEVKLILLRKSGVDTRLGKHEGALGPDELSKQIEGTAAEVQRLSALVDQLSTTERSKANPSPKISWEVSHPNKQSYIDAGMASSLPQSFIDKVQVDQTNGCWNWTAGRTKPGYGRYRAGGSDKEGGRVWNAHVFSWSTFNGPNPEGTIIVHKCSNKGCVNPEHLELTTLAETFRRTHSKSGRKVVPTIPATLPASFLSKLRQDPGSGCWNWVAGRNAAGYGRFRFGGADDSGGKSWYAHVFSYVVVVSRDIEGKVIDHKCENKRCVNPDHLEAVSTQENIRRIHKRTRD